MLISCSFIISSGVTLLMLIFSMVLFIVSWLMQGKTMQVFDA